MDKLHILAIVGVALWFSVLYFFICMKIQRRWLTKKMNLQWIENHEKKTKLPITRLIAGMEKAIQFMKKANNVILGFTIFTSILFLADFFLNMPHNTIVFGGLILAGEGIPAWIILHLVITFIDDRRKRIIEIMKETRSGQQSGLSKDRERNRTEMKDI